MQRHMIIYFIFFGGGGVCVRGRARLSEGVQAKAQPQIGSCKLHVNYSKGALINFQDFKFCTFSTQFFASLTFK